MLCVSSAEKNDFPLKTVNDFALICHSWERVSTPIYFLDMYHLLNNYMFNTNCIFFALENHPLDSYFLFLRPHDFFYVFIFCYILCLKNLLHCKYYYSSKPIICKIFSYLLIFNTFFFFWSFKNWAFLFYIFCSFLCKDIKLSCIWTDNKNIDRWLVRSF